MIRDITYKVTKGEWYSRGGVQNSRCFRRMIRGRWTYYYTRRFA